MTRAFAGARERAQTVEEPFHPSDLARDDPAEVVDEPIVAAPTRQELGEGLDRDERVLDLVRDPGREHLEIREPLGAAPLDFELLQWRKNAEDRDRAQHRACRNV